MSWEPQTVLALVIVALVVVVFWMKYEKEQPIAPKECMTCSRNHSTLDTERMLTLDEHFANGLRKIILITSDTCSYCVKMETLFRRRIMTKPEFMASVVNIDTDAAVVPGLQVKYGVKVDELPALITDDKTGVRMRNGLVEVQRALTDMVRV